MNRITFNCRGTVIQISKEIIIKSPRFEAMLNFANLDCYNIDDNPKDFHALCDHLIYNTEITKKQKPYFDYCGIQTNNKFIVSSYYRGVQTENRVSYEDIQKVLENILKKFTIYSNNYNDDTKQYILTYQSYLSNYFLQNTVKIYGAFNKCLTTETVLFDLSSVYDDTHKCFKARKQDQRSIDAYNKNLFTPMNIVRSLVMNTLFGWFDSLFAVDIRMENSSVIISHKKK